MNLIQKILDKTNGGLDILLHYYPSAGSVINGQAKKFAMRDEKTPSATIRFRNGKWKVCDFGGDAREMDAIDVAMAEEGKTKTEVIHLLANRYDVKGDVISKEINKPTVSYSEPKEDQQEGYFYFKEKDYTEQELKLLGPNVTAKDCKDLSFRCAKFYSFYNLSKKKNKPQIITVEGNENYPIFIRACKWKDSNGELRMFYKVYKPLEADKSFRFMYFGEKPKHFVNGLFELDAAHRLNAELEEKRFYSDEKNEGKDFIIPKLDKVFICSGERDALCLKSMGYNPVWFNSETYNLQGFEYAEILKYANHIYNVPDIDSTGIKRGIALALQFIGIYTVWLPNKLKDFKDNRGNPRKDLRDFVEIWPDKYHFANLVSLAMPAKFWEEVGKKKEKLELNTEYLLNCLHLNGFRTMPDLSTEYGYSLVHIEKNMVERMKIKDIKKHLRGFVKDKAPQIDVLNLINNSGRINESNLYLDEIELNFDDFTPNTQYFYFKNATWLATPTGIQQLKQGESPNYVWKDRVIDHNVKLLDAPFTITCVDEKADDVLNEWDININSTSSKFFGYMINASRIYWRKELEPEGSKYTEEENAEYAKKYKFAIDGPRLNEEEIKEQKLHLVNKIFAMGYLLHKYKNVSRAWCVFSMDNTDGNIGESNGGTGKSLFFEALKRMRDTVQLDGQSTDLSSDQFAWQNVTEYTDLIYIDDASASFQIKELYSAITSDLAVNPKGTRAFSIPFSQSPKVAVSTNHTERNNDGSTSRRMLHIAYSDYYHAKTDKNNYLQTRKVYDDFGKNLFDNLYSEDEWNADLNFMAYCCQFYLSTIAKNRLIQPPMNTVKQRRLRASIGAEFMLWADTFFGIDSENCNEFIRRDVAFKDFVDETGVKKTTMQYFTKKLADYCEFAPHIEKLNPDEFKNKQGTIKRFIDGKTRDMIYIKTYDSDINPALDINEVPTNKEDLPF